MSVRRVPLVALLIAVALLLDVIAATVVHIDRRDAATLPDFRRVDVSDLNWDISPYAGVTSVDGFTVDLTPPASVTRRGRVTYRDGLLSPTHSAVYALAALERYDEDGDRRWLERARNAIDQVLATSRGGFLPHTFDDTDEYGDQLPNPWYSASAQGLVLSAMAELYRLTGDQQLRVDAAPVFRAMTAVRGFFAGSRPAPQPWLAVVDEQRYLWFETFTYLRAPVQVLSEQTRATLGVYDFVRVLATSPRDERQGRALLAGGLATLRKAVPAARQPGTLGLHSLAASTQNPAGHVALKRDLGVLADITGQAFWAKYQRLLDLDDDLPLFDRLDVRIANDTISPYQIVPNEPRFSIPPRDPAQVSRDGAVTYRDGATDPALSASYALACLARYADGGRSKWLAQAQGAVTDVLDQAQEGLLPYRYPNTDVYGSPLPQPWFSAEGQGLMTSALVRLWEVTGDRRWLDKARPIVHALLNVRDFSRDGSPPPRRWVSFIDDDGFLWFEQYGGGIAASLVVNGHLAAVLGTYDYWRATKDPIARSLFIGGTSTMLHWLPKIRRGDRAPWYAVGNRESDARFDPVVTRQLRQLAAITGREAFNRFADRG